MTTPNENVPPAGPFAPYRWIDHADQAGIQPTVCIQPDGRRWLHMNEIDTDPDRPPALDRVQTGAVIDALTAVGRVVDGRAASPAPGC